MAKLKYIKVDTEGYDLFVLKSLDSIIDEFRPFVRAEVFVESSLENRNQLFSFFADKNYYIYKVTDERNLMGRKLSDKDLMKWAHFDIFCVPAN